MKSLLMSILAVVSLGVISVRGGVQGAFELRTLDTSIADPWLKTVGDLDGDGRTDIVVGGAGSGGLAAYRSTASIETGK